MEWITLAVDYGVIGILVFLCFIVVAFGIERALYYSKVSLKQFPHKQDLEICLRKNLQFIGTVAGNAPYVGLLGTVLSIMLTFYNIGLNSSLSTESIMASLALALKATAVGLIVAIVAVVIYNALSAKAQMLLLKWEVLHEE